MVAAPNRIGIQALAIVSSNTANTVQVFSPGDVSSQIAADPLYFLNSQFVPETFSSVPVIYDYELQSHYTEVASALAEMKSLEHDDLGAIEPAVYSAATAVASELLAARYPSPRIFTHGPKSVVFNWTEGDNNLYLTVSADAISALISTPAKIERRIDFTPNALTASPSLLLALKSAHSKVPSTIRETASSEPFHRLG